MEAEMDQGSANAWQDCRFCKSRIPKGAKVCWCCKRDLEPRRLYRDPRSWIGGATTAAAFFTALGTIWLYFNLIRPFASPKLEIRDAQCWADWITFSAVNRGSRAATIYLVATKRTLKTTDGSNHEEQRDLILGQPLLVPERSGSFFSSRISEAFRPDGERNAAFSVRLAEADTAYCSQTLEVTAVRVERGADGLLARMLPRSFDDMPSPVSCTCKADPVAASPGSNSSGRDGD